MLNEREVEVLASTSFRQVEVKVSAFTLFRRGGALHKKLQGQAKEEIEATKQVSKSLYSLKSLKVIL